MTLVDLAIKKPVSVTVGVLLLTLFGIISLLSIPVQLTPDVTRPQITVTTHWPGASPQEIEREIVDEQEQFLKNVEGLTKLKSESKDSMGTIILEFSVGTDIDAALLRVSTKLDQVPSYPEDAERPVLVSASENASPIAWIILKKIRDIAQPVYTLRNFLIDTVQPRLERVRGVAKSNVFGGQEEEMQVVFDEKAVAARNLTIQEITTALREGNKNISAGNFDEGKRRYIARTQGEYEKTDDADNVVIKYVGNSPVLVKDVAEARWGFKKRDNVVRNKAEDSIAVNVIRQAGSNVLVVMEGVKQAIKSMNETIMADLGLRLEQVYDETDYIKSAITLVRQNLFVGGSLAIAVLLLFLRSIAPTLIIALAIPISIVGTFLMMVLFGRTINVISLAGMAFASGMVVDNAIVVLENIYRHHQSGESREQSANAGTKEVWGAVLASTLTTIAVFLPVIFVAEEAGQLFRDIAIAICCAVFLSLIVSITVIPSLAARIISTANEENRGKHPVRNTLQGLFGIKKAAEMIVNGFAAFIYWICGKTILRVLVICVMTAAALSMVWFLSPKAEYLPEGNRNLILGIVLPPPGYSIAEFEEIGKVIEEDASKYYLAEEGEILDGPALSNFFFVAFGQQIFMGAVARDPMKARGAIPILKRILGKIPGMIPIVRQTSLFSRAGNPGRSIDVDITGPDMDRLIQFGQRIFGQIMELIPGSQLRPIPNLDLGNPEVRIIPDRYRAAKLGLTASQIGINVDALLDGIKVGEVRRSGNNVDLTLMGKDETIRRIEDFDTLQINTPLGKTADLKSVAKINLVAGPTQINHIERLRSITIQVLPPETIPLEQAMDIIREKVIKPLKNSGELERPYGIGISGTADDLTRTRKALQWNLLLAIIITFLLMASLFESFLYPFVIMFSVPLAAAGGFLGLYLVDHFITHQAMDILTMLGFVILIGIVVNNAILIVHQSLNFMRHQGIAPKEAIRESVRTRIRPIFMSTLTSVMGMIPLVLFPGAGSELYRGLGGVVIGGLIVSTIFTLILVPSLFSLVLDIRAVIVRREV